MSLKFHSIILILILMWSSVAQGGYISDSGYECTNYGTCYKSACYRYLNLKVDTQIEVPFSIHCISNFNGMFLFVATKSFIYSNSQDPNQYLFYNMNNCTANEISYYNVPIRHRLTVKLPFTGSNDVLKFTDNFQTLYWDKIQNFTCNDITFQSWFYSFGSICGFYNVASGERLPMCKYSDKISQIIRVEGCTEITTITTSQLIGEAIINSSSTLIKQICSSASVSSSVTQQIFMIQFLMICFLNLV